METYPPINRISRDELAEILIENYELEKAKREPKTKIAVVDVRDHDFIGGHIHHAFHRPSSSFSDHLNILLVELQPYDTVVFHCSLSQQRGPSAALAYMKERAHIEARKYISSSDEDELLAQKIQGDDKQQVYVLDGGFADWQEKYGDDERLTENYNREIWGLGV
ncbi:hypothetical protein ABW19_dt0210610 [Dactylella cylindrospora]|nr:hypothetical protein ABW19_dt0210610 [Dactylella cylindrospora]